MSDTLEPCFTQDQIDLSIKIFSTWTRIRHNNGQSVSPADVDHSSLLRRLLAGKPLLVQAPPLSYSSPAYRMLEDDQVPISEINEISNYSFTELVDGQKVAYQGPVVIIDQHARYLWVDKTQKILKHIRIGAFWQIIEVAEDNRVRLYMKRIRPKYLMLDIDGVLNGHEAQDNHYCTIDRVRMKLLNQIVRESKCRIIIISSWRYLVLQGSMTIRGFGQMLATYGASLETQESIDGTLGYDVNTQDRYDRGKLVLDFLNTHIHSSAVVIDNDDFGYTALGLQLVQPQCGITEEDAQLAIQMLS